LISKLREMCQMKSINKLRISVIAVAVGATLSSAVWADQQDDIQQLKQQVEELNQKLQVLEQQQEINKENTAKATEEADKAAKAAPVSNGVKIKVGGYIDATSIYRDKNEVSDVTSTWVPKAFTTTAGAGIPFANTPQAQTPEYRETARASRLSLLATGNPDDKTTLTGYIETDFQGAAQTANSQQSNAYTPRLRQAYTTWDQSDLGLHFLAGQSWSLATAFKDGLTPRDENIPITLDSGYVPGFNETRNPQLRLVKDFNHTYWLGLSLESPQALVGGTAPSYLANAAANGVNNPAVGTAFTAVPTISTVFSETGGSGFNSVNAYSTDSRPDVILKGAADPGWGHYELYGLYRWFTDYTNSPASGVLATANTGSGSNSTTNGEGIGGSVLLPVVPKILDLQGSFLTGNGIGRYGQAQLPDVTYNLDGTLATIHETDFLLGAILHPTSDVDIFGYFGKELADQQAFESTGLINPIVYLNTKGVPTVPAAGVVAPTYFPSDVTTFSGYGLPQLDTYGCNANAAHAVGTAVNCAAVTAATQQWTLGGWWRFYHGTYGTVQWGASFSHTSVSTFAGISGAPTPDINIYLLSFRYYPYQ
jgi:hypothetical protein